MSKKQQLVQKLVEQLVDAGVDFTKSATTTDKVSMSIDSLLDWKRYPSGYYNENGSVVEYLSLLTEENLISILNDRTISVHGVPFGRLWRLWGQAGYLKSDPFILYPSEHPVLRIRHDNYLSLMGKNGFQVCRDAYGHNPIGLPGENPEVVSYLCNLWQSMGVDDKNPICTLMVLGLICEAGSSLKSFNNILFTKSNVMDAFVRETDEECLRVDLRPEWTIKEVKRYLAETPISEEMPEVCIHLMDDAKVFATLTYYQDSVKLVWVENFHYRIHNARFPKWDKTLFENELSSAVGGPTYPGMQEYLYLCWVVLTSALTGLAGIMHTETWCSPVTNKFDMIPRELFGLSTYVSTFTELWNELSHITLDFPSTRELVDLYMAEHDMQ